MRRGYVIARPADAPAPPATRAEAEQWAAVAKRWRRQFTEGIEPGDSPGAVALKLTLLGIFARSAEVAVRDGQNIVDVFRKGAEPTERGMATAVRALYRLDRQAAGILADARSQARTRRLASTFRDLARRSVLPFAAFQLRGRMPQPFIDSLVQDSARSQRSGVGPRPDNAWARNHLLTGLDTPLEVLFPAIAPLILAEMQWTATPGPRLVEVFDHYFPRGWFPLKRLLDDLSAHGSNHGKRAWKMRSPATTRTGRPMIVSSGSSSTGSTTTR
jgi:hypothetical protein